MLMAALVCLSLALPAVAQAADAVQVAAGAFHTCATLQSGQVKCWGLNSSGQLGIGDAVNRGEAPGQMGSALPVSFINQRGPIVQMALGGFHTCVLDAVGDVRCWGDNVFGQLGYGHANNLGDNPGEVNGGMARVTFGVQKIAAGVYHTCALKLGGTVWCWGYNAYGQLGTGDTQNRRDGVNNAFGMPSLGTGRRAIDLIAAAYSTCALLDNQTVKCWGHNGVGTLGLGDAAHRGDAPGEMGDALPAVDLALSPIKQLVGGGFHICAVGGAGLMVTKCWGDNSQGQLGLGDLAARGNDPGEMGASLPTVPGYAGHAWSVVAGAHFTCLPASSGFVGRFSMKCHGYNGFGQLGLGHTDDQGDNPGEVGLVAPAAVPMGTDPDLSGLPWSVQGMAAGHYHACAVLNYGVVKCWGYNAYGQLGQGDVVGRGGAPGELGDALPPIDL